MKISVRRSGGFAGISRTRDVSTTELPQPVAQHLQALASAIPATPLETLGADNFHYAVTLEDETGSRTFEASGENNPVSALANEVLNLGDTNG